MFVQSYTALIPGSPMFKAWLSPPLMPLLEIYVFNITNPQQVLEGEDPVTVELGPYVYSAQYVRNLQTETQSHDSLSFKSKTIYTFMPELSSGLETDQLTVLNMVMFTGFNKARPHFSLVKTNIALPLLTSIGRGKPVLTVTVGGFLFGYEDDLACITNFGMGDKEPEEEYISNIEYADDDWRRKKRSVPSYRESNGSCIWGMLRDLNNTEHETIRIKTGYSDFRTKGRLVDIDGRESFGAWNSESSCDRLSDSIEPSSLPAGLGQSFSLLVPVMCRKIKMVATENRIISDIPTVRYVADPNSMSSSSCYCPNPEEDTPCLPDGYLNLEPCYPDISPPMAVSFPHGLHSPPSSVLTHQPSPDLDKHQMYMDINTDLGIPLSVRAPFQLSAILKPDPAFPVLNKLKQTRLVPLFWASEGFRQPTPWMVSQTKLGLALPAVGTYGLASLITIVGLSIIFTALVNYWRKVYCH